MKFKAAIRDIRLMASICHMLQKFHKKCILKLDKVRIRFIASAGASDGTQVWVSCSAESIFGDIRLESSQENIIYLEIADVSQLTYALRASERAASVSMKLSSIAGSALLRLAFQNLLTHHDASHDIPVRVMTAEEVAQIAAPPMDPRVLQAVFPYLGDLARFADSMKSAGCNLLTFSVHLGSGPVAVGDTHRFTSTDATQQQTANTLVISSEGVRGAFQLQYNGVEIPPRADAAPAPDDDDGDDEDHSRLTSCSVTVDIRRFARFLAIKDAAPVRVIGHIVDGCALVLSACVLPDTNFVCYISSTAQ